MAAKKNGKASKQKSLPKGFVPVRSNLDGFFERVEGNSVTGILRGSFEVAGRFGKKQVFRIQVTEGETQVGEGEMIGPGGTVGLDSTGYTKSLADLDPGTGIYVRYEGKEGPGQQDAHVFTVGKAS